ncbi:hypothetical protein LCGC14_2767230 [marine sediment metagenome]|uniref:Uncharacterized protein n=1 Tax=marine sediment metagenome TaxID=412755 RepID=A0A0F8ZJ31_9ZZZZ
MNSLPQNTYRVGHTDHTVRTTIDSDTGETMFAVPASLAGLLGVQHCVWLTRDEIRNGSPAVADARKVVASRACETPMPWPIPAMRD